MRWGRVELQIQENKFITVTRSRNQVLNAVNDRSVPSKCAKAEIFDQGSREVEEEKVPSKPKQEKLKGNNQTGVMSSEVLVKKEKKFEVELCEAQIWQEKTTSAQAEERQKFRKQITKPSPQPSTITAAPQPQPQSPLNNSTELSSVPHM